MRRALLVGLAGCSFTHGVTSDGGNGGELTVGFVEATSSAPEVTTVVPVRVTLSAPSAELVEVDYVIAGGTAMRGSDFTADDGMLSFAPGETDKSIAVHIIDGAANDPDETIILQLKTPAGAQLGTQRHTLTIKNTAGLSCVGDGGYIACFPMPTQVGILSGNIDTDASSFCTTTTPIGWSGQPDSCFIVARALEVGAINVFGSRPLVLFASESITITGNVDVATHRAGKIGPGAPYVGCQAFPAVPMTNSNGAGGGAGGTFRSKGGDGGHGTATTVLGGAASAAEPAPTFLRAGCSGQRGGASTGTNGSYPGIGGGALYIAAGTTMTIKSGVTINASGAGGEAGAAGTGFFDGGGGAGAGGMIKLHATTISANGAIVMANGGGGASGSDENDLCAAGNDPTSPTMQPTGGIGGGGNGGLGFAGGLAATIGASDGSDNGGGGGGGGGGHVESNVTITGATISTGG